MGGGQGMWFEGGSEIRGACGGVLATYIPRVSCNNIHRTKGPSRSL